MAVVTEQDGASEEAATDKDQRTGSSGAAAWREANQKRIQQGIEDEALRQLQEQKDKARKKK